MQEASLAELDAGADNYRNEIKAAIDNRDEDALIKVISNNRERLKEAIDEVS